MAVVIGILALTAAVLLSLLLFHRSEMKHISRQLGEIVNQDTNELVHTVGAGGADRELIDAVNGVLEKIRREGIAYRKKRHDLEMMITNISHDLRTPLTSAMGYVPASGEGDFPGGAGAGAGDRGAKAAPAGGTDQFLF